MQTLYVSQQGCYVCLDQEMLVVKQGDVVWGQVQLPLLEQVLIFGKSQVTSQAIRACLQRNIPIVYLSRMGYCYGRTLPIERGYRQLARYQQQLGFPERLQVAQKIVQVKLNNSRTLLQRQQRRQNSEVVALAIKTLQYCREQAGKVESLDRLMGFEGAGAAQYFSAFEECLDNPDFVFVSRSKRPPGNPVNAMLSFGYQVLWNHLLSLIELQGLDPYSACLHQGTERHAALASDLIEEFRAPMVDALVMWLVNRRQIDKTNDFLYKNSGCYLNDSGRRKFLKAFVQRMEETITNEAGEVQPKWDLLTQQVKKYKQFVYQPTELYSPYQIR
jgi:CRISP-associated protein Cas1